MHAGASYMGGKNPESVRGPKSVRGPPCPATPLSTLLISLIGMKSINDYTFIFAGAQVKTLLI